MSYQQALKMKNKLTAFVFQNKCETPLMQQLPGGGVVCGFCRGKDAWPCMDSRDIGAAKYFMLPSPQHLMLGCLKYQKRLVMVIPVIKMGLEQL